MMGWIALELAGTPMVTVAGANVFGF